MRAAERFLQGLVSRIDSTQLAGKYLVLRLTEHIVRGLTLERTLVPGTYYLWSVVVPLCAPVMPNVSLNYSSRVYLDANRSTLDLRGSDDLLIDQTAELVNSQYLDYWRALKDTKGFLSHHEPDSDASRINIALDFAIAHCLSGNIAIGVAKLKEIASSKPSPVPILEQVRRAAERLAASRCAGEDSFIELIASFEDVNVKAHFPGLVRQ